MITYCLTVFPLTPNTWLWLTLNPDFVLNCVLRQHVWSSEAWLSKHGWSYTCSECCWRTSTEKNTCSIARFLCGSTAFLFLTLRRIGSSSKISSMCKIKARSQATEHSSTKYGPNRRDFEIVNSDWYHMCWTFCVDNKWPTLENLTDCRYVCNELRLKFLLPVYILLNISLSKTCFKLTNRHLENCRRPPVRHGTTWMKAIQ